MGKTIGESSDENEASDGQCDFQVDFLSPDNIETRCGEFNRVLQFGDIAFAIKTERDEWSDEVSSYLNNPARMNAAPDYPIEEPSKTGNRGSGKIRFAATVGAVLLLGSGLTGIAYWQLQQYVRTQKVASVSSLLAHAPTHNDVLPGRDGKIYVVSASEDGDEWDKQVVLKAGPKERISVVSAAGERARLEQLLDTQGADFITVRLDHPERPVLVVTENTAGTARDAALASLRQAAPYAKQIDLQYASVPAIGREARAALERNGVRYRELSRAHGTTFEVAGALNDGELAALQELVLSFGHKWGTRRVDFKIAMRTDWLKGKSYREGGEGYVLLDHASWYFPQPLTGNY
ncbi:type III secretion protein [Burkholderia sp. ABCPW 14]|nr:type III secretion protein [Burkholderia sp. ABCPW 14]